MNPLQIMNVVAEVIVARPISAVDRWILMIADNKLACVPFDGNLTEGFPIMSVNRTQAEKGFAGREYDMLLNRITTYQMNHPSFYNDAKQIEEPEKSTPESTKDEAEPNEKTNTDAE